MRILKIITEFLNKRLLNINTTLGRRFELVVIVLILASLSLVFLESIPQYQRDYQNLFEKLELYFLSFFVVEYFLRIIGASSRYNYLFSFHGIIDFLSIVPRLLSLLLGSTAGPLAVIRLVRLLRILRLFKLTRYVAESDYLVNALKRSRYRIVSFLGMVFIIVVFMGALVYLVEGEDSGYTSLPVSVYWAIVTLTTVGFGDIAPVTPLGRFIAGLVMLVGYSIIAIPTGIITLELNREDSQNDAADRRTCHCCSTVNHQSDAKFCRSCGNLLG